MQQPPGFSNRYEKAIGNIIAEFDSDHEQQSNYWYFKST
jgi:hypothetical protein